MISRLRIPAALAVAGVLAIGTSACSGAAPSGAQTDAAGSLIVVTPTPVGSNNFLQLAVDGAKEAGKEHGLDVRVFESNDPTSIQQNIDAAVRDKPTIVVGLTFSVLDQITEAAADHPDQQFLLIDTSAEKPTANLTAAVFKEYEATYLTGVEAGLLTKKNSVGVVAALDTPFIHRWVDPFFAGAKSVNPSVATAAQYVGGDNPFGDQARAKAQALVLAQGGADYIQAAASGGNTGVFEAAKEAGVSAFGVDTNQCLDAPGTVVDVAVENGVGEILGGNAGGVYSYGLKEGGVGLTGLEDGVAQSKCLIADHPDVIEKVAQVRDSIVSGALVVPDPLTAG